MSSSSDTYEHSEETIKLIYGLSSTEGKLESPINLNISCMTVVKLNPLQWLNYDVIPKKLKLTNTGNIVILSASWHEDPPYLYSGPFTSNYFFSQLHFHWGETDMNGSEHYIDGGSMPMELHAVHYNSNYDNQETALHRDDGVTILVYFFQLQATSNPVFDEIIKALSSVKSARSSVRLFPSPIMNILQCFQHDYFLYWGSITMTDYAHSVLWVICRVPLGISIEQAAEFRTLHDEHETPILTNCRALQDAYNRNIFHVCPTGSRYATLLPIPRKFTDIPQDNINDNDA